MKELFSKKFNSFWKDFQGCNKWGLGYWWVIDLIDSVDQCIIWKKYNNNSAETWRAAEKEARFDK